MSASVFQLKRRDFMKYGLAASGSLILGVGFANVAADGAGGNESATANASFIPNAFIRIDKDSTVIVIAKHLEMGQGIYTGMSTLVADELDADWSQIRVESAPADTARYNNLD